MDPKDVHVLISNLSIGCFTWQRDSEYVIEVKNLEKEGLSWIIWVNPIYS